VAAGPYEDGRGGAILLNAEDQAAEKLVAADPYTQLDVTKDRYLRPWKVVVGGVTA